MTTGSGVRHLQGNYALQCRRARQGPPSASRTENSSCSATISAACYTKTQMVPTLRAGDVVILDNLSSHKSPAAAAALRDVGAWFLFLPPYSPDLNPIEMAFAKLKALIRKAAARTYDQLWAAVGQVCDLFSDEECYNYFKAAGYEVD